LILVAIQSFADKSTRVFFESGKASRAGWANVSAIARRKLDMVHYASKLVDLKIPPGNHLEALSEDLAGKHSIRINVQWRIVFQWTAAGPAQVEITDYH
jgi:proteic killer suppression protein